MLDVSSENLLRSVFHTLAYADVFDYPLTAGEVYRYLTATRASFDEVASALADSTVFTRTGGYFTLHGREEIVRTRKQRAEIANELWSKATRYGRLIASLPFVRMVAVTGSLAMSNTDQGTDIDFMIVTAPGRLWTVRALSLLVARVAKREGVNLCPNYLVTTHGLELPERSLYVAHELTQMIPLSGMEVYRELRRLNDWTEDYLPNASGVPEFPKGLQPVEKRSFIQRAFEVAFRLPQANWFEKWEMKRKIARLTREQSASYESYFSADVCKGHVDRHGQNVETALAARLQRPTEVATPKTI